MGVISPRVQIPLSPLTTEQFSDTIYYVQEDANSVASDWGSTPHNSIARGCQGFDGVVRLYLLTGQKTNANNIVAFSRSKSTALV